MGRSNPALENPQRNFRSEEQRGRSTKMKVRQQGKREERGARVVGTKELFNTHALTSGAGYKYSQPKIRPLLAKLSRISGLKFPGSSEGPESPPWAIGTKVSPKTSATIPSFII